MINIKLNKLNSRKITRYDKIPNLKDNENWNEVFIDKNNSLYTEELVKIEETDRITIRPQYFINKTKNSMENQYVRKSVYNKLLNASLLLRKGYKLVVFDAYRPLEVQRTLYYDYKEKVKKANPLKSEEEIETLTRKFISLPSINSSCPSTHLTGGAIDLTIMNNSGYLLDMGTKFDEFNKKTKTDYYEQAENFKSEKNDVFLEIRNNRRLLYNIMKEVGFVNYSEEWWHYDFGNQFWGNIKNENAKYSIANFNNY